MLSVISGIARSFGASAIRSVAGPKRQAATMIVLPTPRRSLIRRAVSAAASVPRLPTANTRPIVPAERPSSRTAKTSRIEKTIWPKKFESATDATMPRWYGWVKT